MKQNAKTGKTKQIRKTEKKPTKEGTSGEEKKKAKIRPDDNNNTHKKMITVLNQVLGECGMLQTIKR